MKRAFLPFALLVTALVSALSGCSPREEATAAASGSSGPPGGPYADLAKLPDWSGVWEPVFRQTAGSGPPPAPKLTPEYAKQWEAFQEKNRTTPGINFVSNVANCVPAGLPGSMQQPYPIEFLFTPGRVTIVIETYSLVRRIHTDGRKFPDDPDLTYQGTSIGKWQGDTLVVETIGILPETSPLNGINGHSEQLRITERMRLVQPDLLEIQTTREDPAVFVAPYTTTARYQRHRDWEIMEYVCAQNNRDQLDAQGNAAIDLERRPGE